MEESARKAANAYKREWAKKNKEKVKAAQEKYWAKRASELKKQTEKINNDKLKVGDEIRLKRQPTDDEDIDLRCVITYIENDTYFDVIFSAGFTCQAIERKDFEPTGKWFPQVNYLLKEIK